MNLDLTEVVAQVVVLVVGALGSWILSRIRKARRDVNAAFRKLRMIERHLGLHLNEEKFQNTEVEDDERSSGNQRE